MLTLVDVFGAGLAATSSFRMLSEMAALSLASLSWILDRLGIFKPGLPLGTLTKNLTCPPSDLSFGFSCWKKGGCWVEDTELESTSSLGCFDIFLRMAANNSCSRPVGLSFILDLSVVVVVVVEVCSADTDACELPTDTVMEVSVETRGLKVTAFSDLGNRVAIVNGLRVVDTLSVLVCRILGGFTKLGLLGLSGLLVVVVVIVEVVVVAVVVSSSWVVFKDDRLLDVVVVDNVVVVDVVVVVEVFFGRDLNLGLLSINSPGLIFLFSPVLTSSTSASVVCTSGLEVVLLALSWPWTLAKSDCLSLTRDLNLFKPDLSVEEALPCSTTEVVEIVVDRVVLLGVDVVVDAVVVVLDGRLLDGGLSTFLTLTLGLLMSELSEEKGLGDTVEISLTMARPLPLLLFLGDDLIKGKAVGKDWTGAGVVVLLAVSEVVLLVVVVVVLVVLNVVVLVDVVVGFRVVVVPSVVVLMVVVVVGG